MCWELFTEDKKGPQQPKNCPLFACAAWIRNDSQVDYRKQQSPTQHEKIPLCEPTLFNNTKLATAMLVGWMFPITLCKPQFLSLWGRSNWWIYLLYFALCGLSSNYSAQPRGKELQGHVMTFYALWSLGCMLGFYLMLKIWTLVLGFAKQYLAAELALIFNFGQWLETIKLFRRWSPNKIPGHYVEKFINTYIICLNIICHIH